MQYSSEILERNPQYAQNIIGDRKCEEEEVQKDETIEYSWAFKEFLKYLWNYFFIRKLQEETKEKLQKS